LARTDQLHNVTVDILAERLERTGKYEIISRNRCYDRNGFTGEFDVYARRGVNNLYFEVKSTLCAAALRKAQHQAFRAVIAHADERWRCLLVLPPKGHPASWVHSSDPELRIQRIIPRCHHLPPAQVTRGPDGAQLCTLCGGLFVVSTRQFDAEGLTAKTQMMLYRDYVQQHPRRS